MRQAMSTTRFSSPIGATFQQWAAQQRQQSSSSYRILLQTSYSLHNRICAAEPVENSHIYHRAGQRTPSEQATRDILGGGDSGWLLHLMELAAHVASPEQRVSILYISTKPQQTRPADVILELPQEYQTRIRVLDLATNDPWGWNSENDSGEREGSADSTSKLNPGMNNLSLLYQRIQREISEAGSKPMILIWQSLSPLILVHGFPKLLRWLQGLPPCLQIWPVHQDGLTPQQHALLEDAANALLCLQGGEMTVIREGIRERGNVLRQNLSFHLVPTVGPSIRYRVVEGAQEGERVAQKGEPEGKNVEHEAGDKGNIASNPKRLRPHLELRLEEENNVSIKTNKSVNGNDATQLRLPKIYLQDDDPEFDDLDEEDPDDDLDI